MSRLGQKCGVLSGRARLLGVRFVSAARRVGQFDVSPPHGENRKSNDENTRRDSDDPHRFHVLYIDYQVSRNGDDSDVKRHSHRKLARLPVDLNHSYGLDIDEHEQQVLQHDVLLNPHMVNLDTTGDQRGEENDGETGIFDEPSNTDTLLPDATVYDLAWLIHVNVDPLIGDRPF